MMILSDVSTTALSNFPEKKKKVQTACYLGENIAPLGFLHFYQTGIDVVIILLVQFNPTVIN